MEFNLINFRKKKKEEAKKAEMASTEEEDCSAPKCKRPTGKQVCVPVTVICFPQNHLPLLCRCTGYSATSASCGTTSTASASSRTTSRRTRTSSASSARAAAGGSRTALVTWTRSRLGSHRLEINFCCIYIYMSTMSTMIPTRISIIMQLYYLNVLGMWIYVV